MLFEDFFFSITKSTPKVVSKLLRKAQKHMNVEDVVLVKGMKGRKTKEQATIMIRRKRFKVLGIPQEKRKNFQIGSQSSLTLLL